MRGHRRRRRPPRSPSCSPRCAPAHAWPRACNYSVRPPPWCRSSASSNWVGRCSPMARSIGHTCGPSCGWCSRASARGRFSADWPWPSRLSPTSTCRPSCGDALSRNSVGYRWAGSPARRRVRCARPRRTTCTKCTTSSRTPKWKPLRQWRLRCSRWPTASCWTGDSGCSRSRPCRSTRPRTRGWCAT